MHQVKMRALILCLLCVGLFNVASAKVYERCELAVELLNVYGFPRSELGDWVCLVQWESSYNTAATNVNTNESIDYGLFMINDYYWCISDSPYNDCNVPCADLIDDDISDDVDCVDIIYARHGFNAWYGWINHCEGTDTESYVADCGV